MTTKRLIVSLLLVLCLVNSLEAVCCSQFEKAKLIAIREGQFLSDGTDEGFVYEKIIKQGGKPIQYQIIYSPKSEAIILSVGGFFIVCENGKYSIGAMTNDALLKKNSIEEKEAVGYANKFFKEIGR